MTTDIHPIHHEGWSKVLNPARDTVIVEVYEGKSSTEIVRIAMSLQQAKELRDLLDDVVWARLHGFT